MSARRPWYTVLAWVFVLVAGVAGATLLQFRESPRISGSESDRAYEILEELRGPDPLNETIVVTSDSATVDDASYRTAVEGLIADLREQTHIVQSVTSFYETGDRSLVSADGKNTLLPMLLVSDEKEAQKGIADVVHTLEENSTGGVHFLTVGGVSSTYEFNKVAQHDLEKGEMFGLPAALLVLFVVFGAAVAAGLPVVLGVVGIILAAGMTGVISRFVGISSYALNMITMIGLAVGIDYTLFIVERFREERAAGKEKFEAIVNSGNTASRAVLFSGITVMIAMSGLLIVPDKGNVGLVVGAISVVCAAVAIALTLLPAVLSILGDKVNFGSLPGRKSRKTADNRKGAFARFTSQVQKHPVIFAAGSTAILVLATLPLATIKLGNGNMDEFPDHLATVQGYRILERDFSAGAIDPVEIAIKGDLNSPSVQAAIEDIRTRIETDGTIGEVGELQTNADGTVGMLQVFLAGSASGNASMDAIDHLRSDVVRPAFAGLDTEVAVGGGAAIAKDYVGVYMEYLPYVIGFVLLLSFVLLTMVFRSLVIPLKAIIMNLLSVGASYGLLVAVFQHGWGNELFGFQQTESITAFLPVFLFAVLFGLSMDYHVFLLSRIQERYLHTHDNTDAVGYGLRSTAHIITGAAAIMMVVFGGFAAGDLAPLQQVGFGLGIAVLLDATIVRSILVPASMQLLGDRNWYLPSWLAWLPTINVEGTPAPKTGAPVLIPTPVEFPYGVGADAAGGM